MHKHAPSLTPSWLENTRKTLYSALVMASISLYYSDFFEPLADVSYVVSANLANSLSVATTEKDSIQLVTLGISSQRHTGLYDTISPLPRCQLLDDLKDIYAVNPAKVAIDFDLSPTPLSQSQRDNGTSADCEQRITALLSLHANKTILITPFPTEDAGLRDVKHAWMQQLCTSGVTFAEPFLREGISRFVYAYDDSPLSAAHTLQNRRQSATGTVCHELFAHSDRQGAQSNGYLTGLWREPISERDTAYQADVLPINFAEFENRVLRIDWDMESPDFEQLRDRKVIFGPRYGEDDLFETPLGRRYGMDLHGAVSTTLDHPIRSSHVWEGWLSDIVLGLIIGGLVSFVWGRYFRAVDAGWAFCYLWLVAAIGIFLVAFLALSAVAYWALVSLGVWMSPIPMAAGMFLDFFVVGTVQTAMSQWKGSGKHQGKDVTSTFGKRLDKYLLRRDQAIWHVVGWLLKNPLSIFIPLALYSMVTG